MGRNKQKKRENRRKHKPEAGAHGVETLIDRKADTHYNAQESHRYTTLASTERTQYELTSCALQLLGTVSNYARCLDLGCGSGFSTTQLIKHGLRNWIGVDLSRDMLLQAKAKNHGDLTELDLSEGLCFRDNSVDVCVSISVLQWLPSAHLLSFFHSLRRVISPQGRAVCQVYPTGPQHAEQLVSAAQAADWQASLYTLLPHPAPRNKQKKLFLCLFPVPVDPSAEPNYGCIRCPVSWPFPSACGLSALSVSLEKKEGTHQGTGTAFTEPTEGVARMVALHKAHLTRMNTLLQRVNYLIQKVADPAYQTYFDRSNPNSHSETTRTHSHPRHRQAPQTGHLTKKRKTNDARPVHVAERKETLEKTGSLGPEGVPVRGNEDSEYPWHRARVEHWYRLDRFLFLSPSMASCDVCTVHT